MLSQKFPERLPKPRTLLAVSLGWRNSLKLGSPKRRRSSVKLMGPSPSEKIRRGNERSLLLQRSGNPLSTSYLRGNTLGFMKGISSGLGNLSWMERLILMTFLEYWGNELLPNTSSMKSKRCTDSKG